MTKKLAPEQLPALNREARLDDARSEEEGLRLTVSFSSEEPYKRWFGTEILGHKRGEIDDEFMKSGHAPVLFAHNHTDVVGVIEKFSVVNRRGEASIRFATTARAEEVRGLVAEGVLSNVSVGYRVNEMTLEKESDGEPTYRVTNWTPLELSLVSVPADTSVGIGRSDDGATQFPVTITREDEMPQHNVTEAVPQNQIRSAVPETLPATTTAPPVNEAAVRAAILADLKEDQSRQTELHDLGERFKMSKTVVEKAVDGGMSVDAFKSAILDMQNQKAEASKGHVSADIVASMSEREVGQYSFINVLSGLATGDWSRAGLEREVSNEIAKRTGADPKGLFVPMDMPVGRAALDTQTAGGGAELVGTDHLSGSFIELLRNNMAMTGMGVQVLSGLVGNLEIPKQTGGAAAFWLGEDEDTTQSVLATGMVRMSPKTVAGETRMSRRLLKQSSPDVELMARSDLAKALALELDRAILLGAGTDHEPSGIVNTDGVGFISIGADGGALTWEHIVAMETKVSVANADVGSLGYITNAKVRGKLKTTERTPGTSGQYIWEQVGGGDATVNGYKVRVSNQVPSDNSKGGSADVLSTMVFGNFGDVVAGHWGVLDLMVDPYVEGKKGALVVRAFHDVDIAVRNSQSFVVIDDIVTS